MPLTGQPCGDFGIAGQIDLKQGIANITRPGEYEETSAPAVIDDLVIVGSSIADNDRVDIPDGSVRAFDARTGTLRWSWDPLQDELAPTGAGNVWSTISVDTERGLVFLPTGSASPDYHGLKRPGDNKWANSVVALSAKTGELVWGFQLVHHDLWDYDTAAQPVLGTLRRDGAETPVVIQGNKTGNLFVLNRETGEPVFGVEERAVPKSDADGESASPTQPFPLAPPPLVPQHLDRQRCLGHQPEEREACRAPDGETEVGRNLHAAQRAGIIAFPGNLGGMNWSSGAFDPGSADLRHQRQQPSDGSSPDPPRSVPADRESGPAGRLACGGFAAARHALRHEPRRYCIRRSACPAIRRHGASWSRSICPRDRSGGKCRWGRRPI